MKKLALLAICCVLVSVAARAQSLRTISYYARNYNGFSEKHKARLKRYYLGYGVPSMSFDITAHYVADGDAISSPAVSPSNVTRKISVTGKSLYSSTAGGYYPFITTARNRGFGCDISAVGEAYQYSTGVQSFGNLVASDECATMIISFPIAFVYKSGGEVSLSKKDNVLFSFGVGLAPAFTATKVFDAQASFIARRFAMMEFGLLTGIAWKVRVTYSSAVDLMSLIGGDPTASSTYTSSGLVGLMDITTKGSASVNVSLLVLPFSWNWAKKNQ